MSRRPDPDSYPCGHPRTPENGYRADPTGRNYLECALCKARRTRWWNARLREERLATRAKWLAIALQAEGER